MKLKNSYTSDLSCTNNHHGLGTIPTQQFTLTFHKITPGEGERARVGQSDLRSGSMLICPGNVSDARLGQ